MPINAGNDQRNAIIREATAFSLSSYLFQLISVVRGFVIAWFLGPSMYGIWNIFKTFLEAGHYVAAGSSQAVARELPFNKARGDHRRNGLITRSTLGLCLAVSLLVALVTLMLSSAPWAADYRGEIRVAALVFILNAVHLYVPNQLKGEKKIYLLSIYYIAYACLNGILGLLLMFLWGIKGLLLGMALANLVLISWLLASKHLPARPVLRWRASGKLIAIGFPIMFVAVAPKLMASIDKLIVFWLLDSTATGYYSMAAFLSETVNYIPLALATVLFPRLMYQKGKGADLTQMGYLYDKPMILLAWLMPVLLGLLVINVGMVIRYLLPEYLPAVQVLQILLVGLFFTVVWSVPRGLLVVFDRQRIFIVAIPLFLLLGALVNIVVIKLGYGIVGVACASVLFYFTICLTANLYALRIMKKTVGETLRALAEIHIPFAYGVSGLWLVYWLVDGNDDLTNSLLRSVLFLVVCLPLVLRAERKLQLLRSLRSALPGR